MNEQERLTQRPGGESGLSPGLTEEEAARLLALIAEAYPSPKKDIRAAVMERIRAQREEQTRPKVLPAADSRRTESRGVRLGRAAKWGALAACLVLVTAVGVRFLPALTKNLTAADHAVMNEAIAYDADMGTDEAVAEAMPEMAAEPAEGGVQLKSAQSASGDDVYADAAEMPAEAPMEMPAEEPAAPADLFGLFASSHAAAEPEEPEAACEAEEECAVEEAAYDEAVPAAPDPYLNGEMFTTSLTAEAAEVPAGAYNGAWGGGPAEAVHAPTEMDDAFAGSFRSAGPAYVIRTDCAHAGAWRNSYHDIPAVLIERVGAEEFGAWAAEAEAADPCGVNILSFALRFGLTKEDIYAVGDVWYYLDLPEDLALTEENAAAIEAYYLAGGDRAKMEKRGAEYEFKTAIVREAGLENYLAWRAGRDNNLRAWTVREAADFFGIGEERLGELAAEAGYSG